MNYKRLFLLMAVGAAFSLLIVAAPVAARSGHTADLNWTTFTEAGVAEPNVFIMGEYGALWRVAPDSPISAFHQPVYGTTQELRLDPLALFDDTLGPQAGPYEVGEELGFTLGAWLGAHGTGSYTVEDGIASIDMSFKGLAPNSLYTLWCMRTMPSGDVETGLESCGASDGTESELSADENGEMNIDISFPVLTETDEGSPTMLVLVWHTDGQTYGDSPGPLGYKTFVHLHAPVSLTTR